jgi:hypothetical protein
MIKPFLSDPPNGELIRQLRLQNPDLASVDKTTLIRLAIHSKIPYTFLFPESFTYKLIKHKRNQQLAHSQSMFPMPIHLANQPLGDDSIEEFFEWCRIEFGYLHKLADGEMCLYCDNAATIAIEGHLPSIFGLEGTIVESNSLPVCKEEGACAA